MMPSAELTAEQLREQLSYDPETGYFRRRVSLTGSATVGRIAGSYNSRGYVQVSVRNQLYVAHRLAWLYVHGRWPAAEIDHINGVRDDNRIANLREATHAENQQNVGRRRNNKSGYVGVCWSLKAGKWRAEISHGSHRRFLGYFELSEEAAAAYRRAKAELHAFQPELRDSPASVSL